MEWNKAADKTATTIRMLSAEAVERAKSGHPGMPMGAADVGLALWAGHLNFNPRDPGWPNRDRFVLSAGHGSMLLYSLLHLFGFDLSIEDIKNFRQWESKTPGHPEYKMTPGVETTTGPLGQGVGNAVGMALAAKLLAARINTPKYSVIDHMVYAIVSDGDLMEGIASEACSLAGHLALGNLVFLYDDNDVTIEGPTALAFSEDVGARFLAQGWHVQKVDGLDKKAVSDAIDKAKAETGKPSLIMCKTRIGYGCPTKVGTPDAHGAPLGEVEIQGARECLAWEEPEFAVTDEVKEFIKTALAPKLTRYESWKKTLEDFKKEEPERAALLEVFLKGDAPADLEEVLMAAAKSDGPVATRKASGAVLQEAAKATPFLIGGSADLAPSNNTLIKKKLSVSRENYEGVNLRFGIREHAMGSLANGMALYGFIPYCGTFLVFADYMRPPVRLAALMGLRVIYVFTHDSIFVGEDGPTHQPIEHVSSLRVIPNLHVIRPADAAETGMAWVEAIRRKDGPTALCLTRQGLPVIDRSKYAAAEGLKKGGYVLAGEGDPDLVIIATGSEVALAMEAYESFTARGVKCRVVSMPCLEKFEAQDQSYRDSVIPPSLDNRVVIEAGVSFGWGKYAGLKGLTLGMDRFGASAPGKVLAEKFGFNGKAVIEMIECSFPGLFK